MTAPDSSTARSIVEAENLSRFYGMILGLNNVSFAVRPGITGVVGPNGAGKTTLFRLLLGQIKPSSGSLRVFGEPPWNNPAVQARIAYCPEAETVPAGIGGFDWLVALGMISGLSSAESKLRARRSLDRVKLGAAHWKKRLTSLSKGMRQRVKLAQCLLHEPELVVLDEPMNGLDPMGREEFGNVLRELAQEGRSIVISSHILPDLEALCEEFLLLRWGRIPRSLNESTSADARARWPGATSFRCESPDQLARHFFDRGLVRGCDIGADTGLLHVRWKDPAHFYANGNFHELLLESGVRIFEVQSTASLLEKAIDAPLEP
jgi:ABC-2 type transport system ATP-binding protein